jgi:hypothetical protein
MEEREERVLLTEEMERDEERRETFAHLVERVGLTVDEAERAMRDDDL